ncbi:FAD-binding protein [Psychroserpens burtonensis]|uniref:FAD-binding protein n=1 Tax=Psychroserpens burtonensis TaxID=49278 RepID=A0A5C7B7N2_9FLAO|nr:FAD-binding protein [Psychroserpens burtonensis]
MVGSGFGGSVSALRLSKKGYKVLVVEKRYLIKLLLFLKLKNLTKGCVVQLTAHQYNY